MARATLDSLTSKLFSDVATGIGDPITYTRAGKAPVSLMAHVDYREIDRNLGIGVVEQDIQVEILMSDLAGRPATSDRITFGRITGRIYRPNTDVSRDTAGRAWVFTVKEVK